jgi:hypothetical protein
MKSLFFLLVATVFATVSFSQVQFGLKGGINLATVRGLNEGNSKARVGYHLGALAEIGNADLFIRPEFLYSSKGFGYSATESSSEGTLRLNYLNLPVLFGFRPAHNTVLLAGPELGFLQKAVSISKGIRSDMTGFYRHFDVGFDLGAAYEFTRSVGIEARYNYGFKDLVNVVITDNAGNVIGQGKTGANSVIQVGLYFFLDK